MVEITKDPDKPATKENTEKKEFLAIETFDGSSVLASLESETAVLLW